MVKHRGGLDEDESLLAAGGAMITAGGLLNGHAHFLQWGVIQISLANLIVIVGMIIVFVLALVLPFPHKSDDAIELNSDDKR